MVLGHDISELEGQDFMQFVHPEDVAATIEAVDELRNGRPVVNFVNRYRQKDGGYRWLEWRSSSHGDAIYAAARDITDVRTTIEQEQLVTSVAQLFALRADFEAQINEALSLVGQHVGASRAYVFVDSEEGSSTSNTHEWCAPGISPQIDELQDVPYEAMPSWRPLLRTEGRISCDAVSQLPEDIKAFLEPLGIVSLTVEPLYLIGFDECTGERVRNDSERRLLATISGIVSSAYERHHSDRRLGESEEKLRRIPEGTNAGTWEWNVQTGETVFNERWADIVGYTLAELEPVSIETWTWLAHPEDLRRSERLIEKHLRGESEYYECEVRMRHKDGHWVWIGDRGKLTQWDAEGKPLRMFGTHIDATDRRQALSRLEANKRLLDLFFKQSLDGFFFMMLDEPVDWNDSVDKEAVLDYVFAHQRITRINKAMLEQYRAKEADFLGQTPHDFFSHDVEAGRKVWRRFFDEGHLHIDTEEKRFDGSPLAVEGDYVCIYDDEGRITGHLHAERSEGARDERATLSRARHP